MDSPKGEFFLWKRRPWAPPGSVVAGSIGHTFGVRVQRVQKVQRVQRGRLTALWAEGCGRLSAAGYVRFAQGATVPAALRVADCLSGNAYKVSVTGFTFSAM